MLDQRNLTGVRETYILESHTSFHMIQCLRIRCIFRYRFLIQELEDSSRTCQRVLKLCYHTGDLVERFGILVRIVQETAQLTNRDSSLDRGKGSEDTNTRIHQSVDKTGGRVGNGRKERCFQTA